MPTISDKELLEALHKSLEKIKLKLGVQGEKICAKELSDVLKVINHTTLLLTTLRQQKQLSIRNDDSLFIDIMQTLSRVLDNIYQDMHSIEIEMRGTRDYLADEERRLEMFQYKEQLHIGLFSMQKKILTQRPNLKKAMACQNGRLNTIQF